MHIPKKVLNLLLMASIAGIATTSAATSSCNARSGVAMGGKSNPRIAHVSASPKGHSHKNLERSGTKRHSGKS
ncbi:MAG: hypothetical protein ACXVB1_01785 [Pseudobdellovibrionaceae bacterium]